MYNINNLIKSISIRGYFTLLALIVTISVYAQELTLKVVIVDEHTHLLLEQLYKLKAPRQELSQILMENLL